MEEPAREYFILACNEFEWHNLHIKISRNSKPK
jgi:hypothetical protein